MRVHVLQHVPFEGLGCIAPWFAERDARLSHTRFHDDPRLPEARGLDLIIALGGPMSVNDEASLPWLIAEKAFLREAIARRTPVLGICLGAQLIATALGARVGPTAEKEIGWFPVRGLAPEPTDPETCFHFPDHCTVFHWHGETFDLPEGARRLADSPACRNQAFQLGARIIGLQFHLETTPESAEALITQCRHELIPGTWVQSEAQIRAVPEATYATANRLMERLLAYLTD